MPGKDPPHRRITEFQLKVAWQYTTDQPEKDHPPASVTLTVPGKFIDPESELHELIRTEMPRLLDEISTMVEIRRAYRTVQHRPEGDT